MTVSDQYKAVYQDLEKTASACGRSPEEITLIAVSKTVDMPAIEEAFAAGACHFGENRPVCIQEKQVQLPQATWHFIGNVQSRAIPNIVAHASLIHSVFKESHFAHINQAAAEHDKVQDILIEVNVSGEESKGGCSPDETCTLVKKANSFGNVRVCGLMTMAMRGDLHFAKECFAKLAALHAEIKSELSEDEAAAFNELSMGMSEDWHEAVACGATMIRVGRAIFSADFASE